MNSKKLYVGGLPYSVTEGTLQEIFAAHGTVESAVVISDRMTGRSKGFGFVEMSSQEEAQAAIDKLNGTDLEGRNITVNEAKPREPRTGGGGGGGELKIPLSDQPCSSSPINILSGSADKLVFPVPDKPKNNTVSPSFPILAEQCIGKTPFDGKMKFITEKIDFFISPA